MLSNHFGGCTMRQIYQLTFADIENINEAVLAGREDQNRGIAVAIVDSQGELMSFFRTDDCPISAVNIAINKAFTAARDRQESRSLQTIATERGFHVTDLGDMRYTGLGGGIPIACGKQIVGAVGISGMEEEEDIALAKIGVASVELPDEDGCPD